MPIFEYKGITAKGKNASGLTDAENLADAKRKLRKDGIFPSSINQTSGDHVIQKEAGAFSVQRLLSRISQQQITQATRILATLINAHIPLVEALTALVDQVENIQFKRVLSNVRDSVNEGSALGNALATHPKIFSNLYINMVKAGEASGALDVVLLKLADLSEKQLRLKNKIVSALAYPILMTCFGAIILIILFTFVIPKIVGVFEDIKITLPLPTRILLGITDILTGYWYILIVLILLGVYLFRRFISTPEGHYKYHRFLLKLPIFGNLFRYVAISRFCSTLSTLLNSGVPIVNALNNVQNIVGNDVLKKVIGDATVSVTEGASIAEPLKRSGEFPPIVTHMITVGEKTGELEAMLEKVADSYETQVDTTVTTMTSLIEPIMIASMGAVVGFIVMSIMLPIFEMQQMIK